MTGTWYSAFRLPENEAMRLGGKVSEGVGAGIGTERIAPFGSCWVGLAPDDSPLLPPDAGTQDLYALDWDAP